MFGAKVGGLDGGYWRKQRHIPAVGQRHLLGLLRSSKRRKALEESQMEPLQPKLLDQEALRAEMVAIQQWVTNEEAAAAELVPVVWGLLSALMKAQYPFS